jgi:DNA-binding CsgD family transcriptional regulator
MSCLHPGFFRLENAPTQETATAADLGAELLRMAEPFGVETIAIGCLPATVPAAVARQEPLHPCLGAQRVFGWFSYNTYFLARAPDGGTGHKVLASAAARDAEIGRAGPGLCFKIAPGGDRSQGVIFFAADPPQETQARQTLALLANYAFARLLKIERARLSPQLSERQLEVLAWAAEGKTDQEIATIMGLSCHTVDKYMRQTKIALDATNRTAAIVVALRCGLIF